MSNPAPRHNSDRRSRFRDQLPPRLVAVVRDSFPGRTYTGLRAEIFELAARGGNVLVLERYGVLTGAETAALRDCARVARGMGPVTDKQPPFRGSPGVVANRYRPGCK